MWSGLGWRERPPGHRAARHRYLLGEQRTIKDMIEALHSPEFLYGRATATTLLRVSSPASLPPQSLPVAFQAKAVGGSLNSKINFLPFAVSNCHRKKIWANKKACRRNTFGEATRPLFKKKKKQQLFELDTHLWQQFRHGCCTSLIFECWRSQSPGFLVKIILTVGCHRPGIGPEDDHWVSNFNTFSTLATCSDLYSE